MARSGKPRNRIARPRRARLYFRPPVKEAPGFWPKEADGQLRWASVLSGGAGWSFLGEPEVLTGREIREARMMFGLDYEDAEFREEAVG